MRWLLIALAMLLPGAAFAQGCGSNNPNCIVPLRPANDNSNAAASTAWVRSNGSAGITVGSTTVTGGVSGGILYNNAGIVGGLPASGGGTTNFLRADFTWAAPPGGGGGTPGGTNGQIQFNNAGSFGGFTMSGDCTITTGGAITCTKTNGVTIPQLIASGTAALGISAIGSGTCATVITAAATGVLTTDVIQAGFNGDPTGVAGYQPSAAGMLTIIPYPTANVVNFKVCNNTSGSVTPGAITLNWRVTR